MLERWHYRLSGARVPHESGPVFAGRDNPRPIGAEASGGQTLVNQRWRERLEAAGVPLPGGVVVTDHDDS